MSSKYDLLLCGGQVIDPAQNIHGYYDVAMSGDKVTLVAENIPHDHAKKTKDVTGKLVVPGLVDLHGHFFYKVIPWNIAPDKVCISNGVTTAVDGGSSGQANFPAFRDFIVHRSNTNLYCFLNICSLGLTSLPYQGELFNLSMIEVDKTVECIQENREIILGVKVRVDWTATGTRNTTLKVLEMALLAAEKTQTKVMVHIAGCPIPYREVLDRLRPGDIVSHVFNGRGNNILDWNHHVIPEVWEAAERGIFFDVAHAGVHIDYNVARASIEHGFMPHTLSTDICEGATFGIAKAPTLLEVMSAFLALGLPIDKVIECSTTNPASIIGKSEEIGCLSPGATGDAAVIELCKSNYFFKDPYGNTLEAKQMLTPVLTISKGQIQQASSSVIV